MKEFSIARLRKLIPCFLFLALIAAPVQKIRAQADDSPNGPSGVFNGNVTSGCSYDPYTGNAMRTVTDIVVAGAVGNYPLAFSRSFNSRATSGSYPFGSAGPWRHSYSWTVGSSTMFTSSQAPYQYTVSFPDGRTQTFYFSGSNTVAGSYGTSERFIRLNLTTMLAYLILPDGGKIEFKATQHAVQDEPDPEPGGPPPGWIYTYTYKTQAIIDPHGLRTTFTYNPDGTLRWIVEPAGRWLQLTYATPPWQDTLGGPGLLVDRVTASDGRIVQYYYNQSTFPPGTYQWTCLANVGYYSDASIGTAAYTYKAPNVPNFAGQYNGPPLLATAYDPMYPGAMIKIAYDYKPNAAGVVVGQILRENYADGTDVSTVNVTATNKRQEVRGDGPARTFTYTDGKLTSWTDFKTKSMSQTYDAYGYVNSFTDANTNKTDMVRESVTGRIKTVTHPADDNGTRYSVTYTYTDPANPYFLASVKNERNYTTTFTRDANKRITRIDYPDTGYETFTYNSFGQVLMHRMTNGGWETFTYDARGLKTAYRDPYHQTGNPTARYLYDAYDRLWKVTDALGTSAGDPAHTTVYTYNKRGQVIRIMHPDQSSIWYTYDLHGNRTSVIDELSHTTTYTYDAYRRVTTVKNALNQTSTNSYLPWNKSSSYLTTADFVYAATAPSGKEVWNYADANLRRIRNCVGPYTGADQADTYFTYDNAGNLLTVQDPRANITTYEYDKRNRRTSMTEPAPTSGVTSWEYDPAGNMTKETRPDNKFRRWDLYDSMNRVKHTYGFANEPTSYTYDLAGNLTRLTDAKNANYDFAYDLLNRKTSATYPLDTYGEARYETWAYDTVGNMYRYRTPYGWIKTFTFDSRNRQISATWNTTYGQNVTTTYDAASRVTSIVSGPTTIAFGYDNANRQIWEDQTLSGLPTRRVNTPVDVDGNRSATTLTGVYGLYYEYTQRQQLSVIQSAAQVEWFQYTYDKNGNLTKRQNMYQGLDSTVFEYDNLNRVTLCQQTGANDVPFATSHYAYDAVSNLQYTYRDEQATKGERFTYDADNQLKSVYYNAIAPWNAAPTGFDRSVAYYYSADRLNRIKMGDNQNGSVAWTDYTPNALNQYSAVTGEAPVYNGNFHLYSFKGWTYSYDADARLTSTWATGHSAQMVYDGLGRCVKRTIDGVSTVFTYDGWKPIAEWNSSGALVAWNMYGPGADEILVRYEVGIGYLHYHLDRLGNVQFLLNAANVGIEKYTYDVFGQPKITDWAGNPRVDAQGNPASAYGNRFMFTGREYLSTLGIYDYRHRHYHPGLGRFLQTDPIGFEAGDQNLFRYCGNNPINFVDPDGTIIRYAAGSDGAAISNAINYLLKSPTFAATYSTLYYSTKVYTISTNSIADDSFYRGTNSINWDPASGLRVTSGEGIQSPAMGLAHELVHANDWDMDPAQYIIDRDTYAPNNLDNQVEANAVQTETTIANELGEATRSDHRGTSVSVATPTSGVRLPANFFQWLTAFPSSALAQALGRSPTASNLQNAAGGSAGMSPGMLMWGSGGGGGGQMMASHKHL